MFLEYSISPHSTFYHPKVQFMSLSTVYVLGVLFISLEFYLYPLRIVYVPRVDFMFL